MAAIVLLAAGCGDNRSPSLVGDGGLHDGAVTVDARHIDAVPADAFVTFNPANITKLSKSAPLLDSPDPAGSDCGSFLEIFANDDSLAENDLMPFAAVDNAGSNIWFSYSCKSVDGGWSETVGSWAPPSGTFQRYDGDPVAAGVNDFVDVNTVMSDGQIARSLRELRFAFGSDDHLYGIGSRFRPDTMVYETVPVQTDVMTDLSASSYDLTKAGVFDPPTEAWAMVTGFGRDIMRVGSTFYLYSVHWDGSTMLNGVPSTSIAVATTTDMQSATFPSEPMVTGWTDPMVSAWGGGYHMVARNLTTDSYYYIHGTAPDTFDFAHAVPLNLSAQIGATGAWDAANFVEHGLSGDPRVSTARVVNGELYIFYLAGVAPNTTAATESGTNAKRGMGVLKIPVPAS